MLLVRLLPELRVLRLQVLPNAAQHDIIYCHGIALRADMHESIARNLQQVLSHEDNGYGRLMRLALGGVICWWRIAPSYGL